MIKTITRKAVNSAALKKCFDSIQNVLVTEQLIIKNIRSKASKGSSDGWLRDEDLK